MGTPFKMKGSPMQRNFGIGSPAKDKSPHTGKNPEHKAHKKEYDPLTASGPRQVAEGFKYMGHTIAEPFVKGGKYIKKKAIELKKKLQE